MSSPIGKEVRDDVRIMLVGGGTAGHVTPLLAVVEELRAKGLDPVNLLFVGTSSNMERQMVLDQGYSFEAIWAKGFVSKGVVGGAHSLALTLGSTAKILLMIRRWRPSVLLVTGGYVSVPAILAGWLSARPVVCILPDAAPGLAVKLAARLGSEIAASSSGTDSSLRRDRVHVTGYPLRRSLLKWDRESARRALGIDEDERVIAILGGSSGALRLNTAVIESLPQMLRLGCLIHATGSEHFGDVSAARKQLPKDLQDRYLAAPRFIHNYGAVLAASDLAISRAGASVLGELPAFGLPSILVPGDFAGRHQWKNAKVLSDAGAAEILADGEVSGQRMLEMSAGLLKSPDRLSSMRQAGRGLARSDAALKIAELTLAVATTGEPAVA